MRIANARYFRYVLPLTRPFDLGGTPMKAREGVVIAVESDSGVTGYGDIAPLPTFSRESIDDALDAAIRCIESIKMRANIATSLPPALRERESFPPSVRFGIESALLDLAARTHNTTGPAIFAEVPAARVTLNALVAGSHYEVLRDAEAAAAAGYTALKLKVGRDTLDRDIETVLALRKRVPETIAIRLDANRAWAFDDAVKFVQAIEECGISYIEEPLRDADRLALFAEQSPVPIAVDETLQEIGWDTVFQWRESNRFEPMTAQDDNAPAPLAALRAARTWVVKPTLTGFPLTYIAHLLTGRRQMVADLVISSSFESGLGLRALACLAACAGERALPAGLDTASWLAKDIMDPALTPRGGSVDLAEVCTSIARFSPAHLEELTYD